ncbi:uncharacterized protein LOC135084764 [Ostrinia nubilalis]|uniref:uncharacterized protein LOC135084764 n=1 Tax=Ostrinia nubilalis TaxID=29057 RepID=UPI00308257C6
MARPCGSNAPAQRWKIDYNQDNDFRLDKDEEPSEQEQRLSKLRRQRRISRSLLSYTEETPTDIETNTTIRRHTHKKRRGKKHGKKRARKKHTKNKFILKLVRTLANHSEEHLEVDIHCSHKKLYPNNSFVRDLVTVLNEKDIKVINNGRVFERNKVTEMKDERRERGAVKVLHKLDLAEPTPPPPAQPTKRHRSKKHKHARIEPLPDTPAPPAVSKKIIIEDFVEVTAAPANDAPARAQKRKRKRMRATSTTAPPAPVSELNALGDVNEIAESDAADRDTLLKLLGEKTVAGERDDDSTTAPPAPAAELNALGDVNEIAESDAADRDALLKLLGEKTIAGERDDDSTTAPPATAAELNALGDVNEIAESDAADRDALLKLLGEKTVAGERDEDSYHHEPRVQCRLHVSNITTAPPAPVSELNALGDVNQIAESDAADRDSLLKLLGEKTIAGERDDDSTTAPPAPVSELNALGDVNEIAESDAADRDALLKLLGEKTVAGERDDDSTTAPPAPAGELNALGDVNEIAESDAADRDALLKLLGEKTVAGERDDDRMQKVSSDEDSLKVEPASIEEAPMLASGEPKRDGDTQDNGVERDRASYELWPMGESRFRSENGSVRRNACKHKHHNHDLDEQLPARAQLTSYSNANERALQQQAQDEIEMRAAETDTADEASPRSRPRPTAAPTLPVKVVMRSNLTFNLGDEFFAWRRRPGHASDLLGELSIPSNSSHGSYRAPPAHAWLLPPRARDDDRTDASTVRPDSEPDESSSSDSSGEA